MAVPVLEKFMVSHSLLCTLVMFKSNLLGSGDLVPVLGLPLISSMGSSSQGPSLSLALPHL
jgi:hypothetical protein